MNATVYVYILMLKPHFPSHARVIYSILDYSYHEVLTKKKPLLYRSGPGLCNRTGLRNGYIYIYYVKYMYVKYMYIKYMYTKLVRLGILNACV